MQKLLDAIVKNSEIGPTFQQLYAELERSSFVVFLLKCSFDYPEYQERLKQARISANKEARYQKYSDAYTKTFVNYRIDRETISIYKDVKSAFELLVNKLIFSPAHPLILTPDFERLQRYVRALTA